MAPNRKHFVNFRQRLTPQRWVEALLEAIGAEVADASVGPIKM